jgi:hypothetical protein
MTLGFLAVTAEGTEFAVGRLRRGAPTTNHSCRVGTNHGQQATIGALVERVSRYVMLFRLPEGNSAE